MMGAHLPRRRWLRGAAAASLPLAATGCGIWPWSSSKPKLPELPTASALPIAWSLPLRGAGLGFQPTFIAGSIWAAARDGTVLRAEAASGREQWRQQVGKPLIAGAGSDGETVVVAARDGTLIALTGAGAPKWTMALGAEVTSVPSVALGVAIVRTSDNRVVAVETDSGRRRWVFQRQNPPLVLRQTSLIAIDATTTYVGLPGGRLVALSLETGALRWEAAVAIPKGSNEIERISDVVGSPLVSGREVCAVTFQGRLACFDTSNGRTAWARDLSSPSGFDLDGRLLVAVDDRGEVHAFSRSGASVWRQDKLRQRTLSAPLLAARQVIVGDGQGLLHALSRDDGALLARASTDGSKIVGTPVAAANLAVVQTTAGALYAVRAD